MLGCLNLYSYRVCLDLVERRENQEWRVIVESMWVVIAVADDMDTLRVQLNFVMLRMNVNIQSDRRGDLCVFAWLWKALTRSSLSSPPPSPIPPLSFPDDPPLYCRVFLEILGLMVQMALLVRWDYLENRFVYKQDAWKVAASLQKHVHRPLTVSNLQDTSLIYCRRHNYVSILVLHQNSKSHMSQFPTGTATWPAAAWKHTQCSWTANRGHHCLSALRHSCHMA